MYICCVLLALAYICDRTLLLLEFLTLDEYEEERGKEKNLTFDSIYKSATVIASFITLN